MKFGVQLYGPLNNMQGEVLKKLSALAESFFQRNKFLRDL